MGGALVVRDEAKDLVPVRTGLLKSAIFAAYGDKEAPDVLVGVNHKTAPHNHWLEFGNVRTKAQPYLRPAITATRAKVIAIVADGLRKVFEKALPRG
jgi:HK97 gp10 family phage protein